MLKILRTSIFIILTPWTVITAQDIRRLEGKVLDADNGNPLEYAHIGIRNTAIGTVTNSNGEFSIIIPSDPSAEIWVTYLGYETFSQNIASITQSDQSVVINLRAIAIDLPELVIKSRQRPIMEEAIDAIPFNHDLGDMVLRSFWRAQIRDQYDYVQLSETAFDIYRLDNRENLLILKGRISRDSAAFKRLHNVQAGAGPETLFAASFLQDHTVISKKTLKHHDYEIVNVTSFDGRNVFVIEFDKKDSHKKNGYQGEILLDAETLAFVRISYRFSPSNTEEVRLFENSKLAGMLTGLSKSTFDDYEIVINYQNYDGMWYLSHVNYDVSWTLIKEKEGNSEPMYYTADFVVTDISKQNITIPENAEFAGKRILEKQVDYSAGNFWNEYNYIVPDQDFEQVFREITKRNIEYSIQSARSEQNQK